MFHFVWPLFLFEKNRIGLDSYYDTNLHFLFTDATAPYRICFKCFFLVNLVGQTNKAKYSVHYQ